MSDSFNSRDGYKGRITQTQLLQLRTRGSQKLEVKHSHGVAIRRTCK